MDVAAIGSLLGSLKTATDIAKFVRESSVSLERAELKMKLAQLIEALSNAKIEAAAYSKRSLIATSELESFKLLPQLRLNSVGSSRATSGRTNKAPMIRTAKIAKTRQESCRAYTLTELVTFSAEFASRALKRQSESKRTKLKPSLQFAVTSAGHEDQAGSTPYIFALPVWKSCRRRPIY